MKYDAFKGPHDIPRHKNNKCRNERGEIYQRTLENKSKLVTSILIFRIGSILTKPYSQNHEYH